MAARPVVPGVLEIVHPDLVASFEKRDESMRPVEGAESVVQIGGAARLARLE